MPAKTETETETEKDIAIAYAFDAFWSAYPRKTAKQAALKAWKKLNPLNGDFEKIMKGLEAAKSCRQWKEENGRFIPFPATWLNGRRFEDEVQAPVKETFPI